MSKFRIYGAALPPSFVRIFVVDNYEPFRRVVASILRNQPELQIICEVSNGLEAVRKAEELQPDLILLDIGLPEMNGIEAARRIRKISPRSKIVFVSQESSVDVAQEAFRLGAQGYVVKTRARKELLAAVKAVLCGSQFLSIGVSDRHCVGPTDAIASRENEQTHVVQFYTDENFWRDNVGEFLCTTVSEGKSVIVCATPPHVAAIHQSMRAHDINVQQLEKVGRFITLDAADTLLQFMNADLPDQAKFESLLGPVIRQAEAAAIGKNSRVTIIGEMVALLWAAERVDATIMLEHLWNGLARTHSFHLRCAHPASGFQGEQMGHAYISICAQHSAIVPV